MVPQASVSHVLGGPVTHDTATCRRFQQLAGEGPAANAHVACWLAARQKPAPPQASRCSPVLRAARQSLGSFTLRRRRGRTRLASASCSGRGLDGCSTSEDRQYGSGRDWVSECSAAEASNLAGSSATLNAEPLITLSNLKKKCSPPTPPPNLECLLACFPQRALAPAGLLPQQHRLCTIVTRT